MGTLLQQEFINYGTSSRCIHPFKSSNYDRLKIKRIGVGERGAGCHCLPGTLQCFTWWPITVTHLESWGHYIRPPRLTNVARWSNVQIYFQWSILFRQPEPMLINEQPLKHWIRPPQFLKCICYGPPIALRKVTNTGGHFERILFQSCFLIHYSLATSEGPAVSVCQDSADHLKPGHVCSYPQVRCWRRLKNKCIGVGKLSQQELWNYKTGTVLFVRSSRPTDADWKTNVSEWAHCHTWIFWL